jgi:TATA-binding protein-associated factor Taf7
MVLGVSDVRKRVEAALEEDERTADYAIEVIDQDGLITLKGRVASAEDKHAAQEIAEAQPGVIDVTNALVVVGEDDDLIGVIELDETTDDDEDREVFVTPVTANPTTSSTAGSPVVPPYTPGVVVDEDESIDEEGDDV